MFHFQVHDADLKKAKLRSVVLQLAQEEESRVEVATLPIRLLPKSGVPSPLQQASTSSSAEAANGYTSSSHGEMKPIEGGWRFEVPMSDSSCIETADLQISDTGLSLMLAGERITVQWPQVVDSANARASYSSRSSKLVVKALLPT